jgi:helix-turn-helix protein
MSDAALSQSAALIVAAAATRIEEETRTLAKLTAKLRGLALVEPEELARLQAVEMAAKMALKSSVPFVSAVAVARLRDALVGEWALEERGET